MQFEQYQSLIKTITDKGLESIENLQDVHDLLVGMSDEGLLLDVEQRKFAMRYSKFAHEMCQYMAGQTGDIAFEEMYWRFLLVEAPWVFESYLYYMEKNRPNNKKFYYPRRRTLKILVDDLQDLEDRKIQYLGVSLPPRVGKLIADDTPVLTDEGWKNHGDLKVGDYVYDYDGLPVRVTHVFPKSFANKRVRFSDGSYIDCHENHEWVVFDRHLMRERIVETKEMIGDIDNDMEGRGHRYTYMIPLYQPIVGSVKDLPVKPYTLGAWLGDGRTTNPDICGDKNDYRIIESIVADGYEISWHSTHKDTGVEYYGFKSLRKPLQSIGMCHSRKSVEKRIPDIYLSASIPQRLELLAGLIDTDGCLRKKEKRYNFVTSSPLLKEDVISLISTFGWRCSVRKTDPKVSSSGIVGKREYWVISFNPTYPIPCRLERKQLFEFSKKRRISITKIEDIEPVSGNCISVQGGIYRVGRRSIPTHNSTLCIFFLSWIMGKRPNSHNAMSGHSGILADGFYGEILNLIGTPEYTWNEIFRGIKIQKKSADKKEITLDKPDRFATLTCRGIDGTWTGAVDISSDGYLYVDDLVRDRMESLSPERLENRYQDYLNVLVDRKNDGSRELVVATRWNVLDPLSRTENEYKHNPMYRFRKIPALNENDETNFDYDYNLGFSTDYYIKMRDRLDKPEWMAKFQQSPYVREGLLFPEEELKMFDGIMPDGIYTVTAACDPAFGGGDSASMPICAVHENGKKYIIDWVHDKRTVKFTIPKICDAIEKYNITEIRFEKNNGGNLFMEDVKDELLRRNYLRCRCYEKPAPVKIHKEEKIKAYSDWVKDNFIFLMPNRGITSNEAFKRSEDYEKAMLEVSMFTAEGKNSSDDAPDSLTQLAMIFEDKFVTPPSRVISSPF